MGLCGVFYSELLRCHRLFQEPRIEKVIADITRDIRGFVPRIAQSLPGNCNPAFSLFVGITGGVVGGTAFFLLQQCAARREPSGTAGHDQGADCVLGLFCLALLRRLPGGHVPGTGQ
ncbi:hypothetical protein D3C71_1649430 [compost metagenome]